MTVAGNLLCIILENWENLHNNRSFLLLTIWSCIFVQFCIYQKINAWLFSISIFIKIYLMVVVIEHLSQASVRAALIASTVAYRVLQIFCSRMFACQKCSSRMRKFSPLSRSTIAKTAANCSRRVSRKLRLRKLSAQLFPIIVDVVWRDLRHRENAAGIHRLKRQNQWRQLSATGSLRHIEAVGDGTLRPRRIRASIELSAGSFDNRCLRRAVSRLLE